MEPEGIQVPSAMEPPGIQARWLWRGGAPDPIPNSEVKPRCADGTAGLPRWESTAPPTCFFKTSPIGNLPGRARLRPRAGTNPNGDPRTERSRRLRRAAEAGKAPTFSREGGGLSGFGALCPRRQPRLSETM